MGKKKRITKTTPEMRAKWEENQQRLERLINRRLEEEAVRTGTPVQRYEPGSPDNQRRLDRIIERRLAEDAALAEAKAAQTAQP